MHSFLLLNRLTSLCLLFTIVFDYNSFNFNITKTNNIDGMKLFGVFTLLD